MTPTPCPACAAPLPARPDLIACPRCGLTLIGPDAEALWQVDRELAALDGHRTHLLARRSWLIDRLRRPLTSPVANPVASPLPSPVPTPGSGPRREASPRSVQNILLGLGGLLLAIAAVVFTVVAWTWVGITGRAGILGAITVLTLAVPPAVLRRDLRATAETFAQLGLVLLVVDGYAAYRVGLAGHVDGWVWAAGVLAGTALVGAAYPRLAAVRGTTITAVVLVQPVPLLVAAAAMAGPTGWVLAGTTIAALDLGIVAWTVRTASRLPECWLALSAGATALVLAAPGALLLAALRQGVAATLPPASVGLLAALVIGAAGALTSNAMLRDAALLGGTAVAATAGTITLGRTPLGILGLGLLALFASAAVLAPTAWRRGPLLAALGLAALAGLAGLAVAVADGLALTRPVRHPWRGAPETARALLDPATTTYGWRLPVLLVLGGIAAAIALPVLLRSAGAATVPSWVQTSGWPVRATVAAYALLVVVVAPVALDLPWLAGMALYAGASVAALLVAALPRRRRTPTRIAAGAAGTGLLLLTVAAALTTRPLTLAVLGGALLVLAGCALCRRSGLNDGAAALAVLDLAGLTAAALLAAGASAGTVTWALLAVLAGVTAAGTVLRRATTWAGAGRLVLLGAGLVAPSILVAGLVGDAPLAMLAGLVAVVAAAPAVVDRRRADRRAQAGYAAIWAVGALAAASLGWLAALIAPFGRLAAIWAGTPGHAGSGLAGQLAAPSTVATVALVALTTTAVTSALAGRRHGATAGLVGAALTLLVLPVALDLPWPLAPAVTGVVAVLAMAALVGDGRWRGLPPVPPAVPAAIAAVAAAVTLAWSLAEPGVTILALGGALVGALAVATRAAYVPARRTAVPIAALLLAVEAAAVPMALGAPARWAAFAVLVTAAVAAGSAGGLRMARPVDAISLEAVAALIAVLALAMSAARPTTLSLALGLTGAVVGGCAVRPDRRPLIWAGALLGLAATWVRLIDLGVGTPEAYTVPAAALTLVLGIWRRHRQPELSSWLAYGPGLAALTLPSLVAVYADGTGALRPFLLGLAAALIIGVGAARRQQATLLIGAVVLTAVAGHELAPALLRLVAGLPRWVPLAVGGAVLLAVGASYEQRRRDLRRLTGALGRMG